MGIYSNLHIILCLCGIWLIYAQYMRLVREKCRSELRDIRNSLFDFMHANDLSYSDASYVWARESMEAMIRSTNWITMFHIFSYFAEALQTNGLTEEDSTSFGDNELLAKKIMECQDQSIYVLKRYTITTGITGLICYILYYLCKTFSKARIFKENVNASIRKMVSTNFWSHSDMNNSHAMHY